MEEEKKTYSLAETIFLIMIYSTIDLIAVFLDLISITFLGTIVQFLGSGLMLIIALVKKNKKALKIERVISKFLAQIVPFLPTLTIIFIIEILEEKIEAKKGLAKIATKLITKKI